MIMDLPLYNVMVLVVFGGAIHEFGMGLLIHDVLNMYTAVVYLLYLVLLVR